MAEPNKTQRPKESQLQNSLELNETKPLFFSSPFGENPNTDIPRTPLPFAPPLTREFFATENFNSDKFLANRRHLPLDELKRELNAHLKYLKNELVEMINRDYSSFVNLSTNLKGVDKVIDQVSRPLGKMRTEVEEVRCTLQEVIDSLEQKLAYRASIREKKASLQLLLNIHESVRKVETLLLISSENGISSSLEGEENSNSAKQIERVAIEYNQMQYLVNKGKGLPLVENIDWRITRIKDTLRANLTSALRSALQHMKNEANYTSTKDALTQILRTYALIDQTKAAEEVIREELIKPFVEVTITTQILDKSPHHIIPSTNVITPSRSTSSMGSRTFAPRAFLSCSKEPLAIMYTKILSFISNDCFLLLEITRKVLKGTSYEILVNSIWVVVVEALMKRLTIIFKYGNPNVFHKNYNISISFVSCIESMSHSKKTLLYLRTHPTYLEFMKRWQLPVYFQLRFREISIQVEASLNMGLEVSPELTNEQQGSLALKLKASNSILMAIERCWASDVFLYGLSHRFWKLTLQLIQRYNNWLVSVIGDLGELIGNSEKLPNSPTILPLSSSNRRSDSPTPHSIPNPTSISEVSDEQTLKQLALIANDIENFALKVKEIYEEVISIQLPASINEESTIEESITVVLLSIQSHMPELNRRVTNILIRRCADTLRNIRAIPTQYRYMNKKPPTEFSFFVPHIMKPLATFCDVNRDILTEKRRNEWNLVVADGVTMRYYKNISQTLTGLKTTEEALVNLKKMRGAGATIHPNVNDAASHYDPVASMSDEDKMRLQILLDVRQFGKELEIFGITLSDFPAYAELYKVVQPYESMERA